MSDKSPAFRFYAADFLADEKVALMDYEAIGVYVVLMLRSWIEGSIPADPCALARMLRFDARRFPAVWSQMEACWEPNGDGRLVQPRLEIERQKQREFINRQTQNGRRGGRPTNPSPNPQETQPKPVGLPNESQGGKPKRKPAPTRFSLSSSRDTDTPSGVSAEPLDPPVMPSGLPEVLPDDIDALKRVAIPFLAAFANVTSREAQAKHGGAYVTALGVFRSRSATTAETWKAFCDAWLAREGKPLFGELAKNAIAFLPAFNRRPVRDAVVPDAQREAAEAWSA